MFAEGLDSPQQCNCYPIVQTCHHYLHFNLEREIRQTYYLSSLFEKLFFPHLWSQNNDIAETNGRNKLVLLRGGPQVDPGHAGEIMSVGWSGNASVSQ